MTFTDAGMPTMLVFAVLWGISSGIGAQAFYGLWASELFATPYRASAQGVMFFVVRNVHRPAELLLPDAARRDRPDRRRTCCWSACSRVALIIGAVWAPKTQGKTLQEIEIERYGAPISPDLPDDAEVARPQAPATVIAKGGN